MPQKTIEKLINDSIQESELEEIVSRIIKATKKVNSAGYPKEYGSHRHMHAISKAIDDAFPSKTKIGNLTISTSIDEAEYHRPLFSNDRILLIIIKNSSNKNADYLKSFCEYNKTPITLPLFAYIYCCFNKTKNVTSVKLRVPKANSCKEYLYEKTIFKKSTKKEKGKITNKE